MRFLPSSSKPTSCTGRARLPVWTRFTANETGATAVEFGLIAVPFIGLLFAVLQIALALWSTQILETAVANAARQLYTGAFQTDPKNSGLTAKDLQANFKKLVCSNVVGVFDCNAMVDVDVRVISSGFAGATVPSPSTNRVYDTSSYGYQSPSRDQVVVVRASMEFPNYTSLFTPSSGLQNGKQLIVASAAFRAEPF
jgi:Flp pilus assembly protein TadG